MATTVKGARRTRPQIKVKVDENALLKAVDILRRWESLDASTREKYQAAWNKPQADMQRLIDAVGSSERLTQRDFAIRVNTRA